MPDAARSSLYVTALKIFSLVVLALMLVSIFYTGWISIANWSAIGV